MDKQIGLEQTPQQYVEHLIAVFQDVKRVLRGDGTLWLNLGDSYNQNWRGGGTDTASDKQLSNRGTQTFMRRARGTESGVKQKDLVGIPWRVAFALQADGWYLRSDIIWAKPNPMPESVRDRPTRAHEYLFLLSKSPKYYYDYKAIQEPLAEASAVRYQYAFGGAKNVEQREGDQEFYANRTRSVGEKPAPTGKNKRSVWTITPQPFKGAHFATFPEKLVEPCLRAGCPPGGIVLDPFCGSGTVGVVAERHGRHFIGIDLNPAYLALANGRLRNESQRLRQDAQLLAAASGKHPDQ